MDNISDRTIDQWDGGAVQVAAQLRSGGFAAGITGLLPEAIRPQNRCPRKWVRLQQPTAKNLDKTELAFGTQVRRFCERYRFSTCWRETPPPGGIRSLADVRARIFARTDVVDEQ